MLVSLSLSFNSLLTRLTTFRRPLDFKDTRGSDFSPCVSNVNEMMRQLDNGSYRKAVWGWCCLWLFRSWWAPRRWLYPQLHTDTPAPHTWTPRWMCLKKTKQCLHHWRRKNVWKPVFWHKTVKSERFNSPFSICLFKISIYKMKLKPENLSNFEKYTLFCKATSKFLPVSLHFAAENISDYLFLKN